ncbi:MAG: Hpt domain-containing protein [Alphaproteobacteria bacterium]|nr:Hpt domain-containing protein [Alphaproteobacteria bacterium]
MNKQLKVAELQLLTKTDHMAVFDRQILDHQTLNDAALGQEILQLFAGQLSRLEKADWTKLELPFEMHTLRGAAAVVGAQQIEALARQWKQLGSDLEHALRGAIKSFRRAAKAA